MSVVPVAKVAKTLGEWQLRLFARRLGPGLLGSCWHWIEGLHDTTSVCGRKIQSEVVRSVVVGFGVARF
ncbi:MAG TPA: hypothetical protein VGM98_02680 [Schlesneria sp.]|jgi:hypothetical protein